jgi:hypothetical protein
MINMPRSLSVRAGLVHPGAVAEAAIILSMTRGAPPPRELTGSATVGDIDDAIASLDGTYQALNAAIPQCAALAHAPGAAPGMTQADIVAWAGQYQGWTALVQRWSDIKAGTYGGIFGSTALYYASSTLADVGNYQHTASLYSAKLAQACPSLSIVAPQPVTPPTPGTPGTPSGSWLCRTLGVSCDSGDGSDWSGALKTLAWLGIVLAGIYVAGPFVAAALGAGAGAIRKRASGRDEFDPMGGGSLDVAAFYGLNAANGDEGDDTDAAESMRIAVRESRDDPGPP